MSDPKPHNPTDRLKAAAVQAGADTAGAAAHRAAPTDAATRDNTTTGDAPCAGGGRSPAGSADTDSAHDAYNDASSSSSGGGDGGCGPAAGRRPRRRFSPAVLTKLHAARLWIMINRPYYCRALLACPLIPTDSRPTMTIVMDHRWRIFVNEDFVTGCSVEKTAAALIHEINHALRSHAERGLNTASPALVEYWKVACELEINDDLQDDGLDIDDTLIPETFGLEDSQTAETYYRQLVDTVAALGEVPDCGPVCAAHPQHHRPRSDGTEGVSDLQRWLIRQATAKAILEAHDDDWNVPAGLRLWANNTAGATADWRQVLARALRHSLHTTAGASDYTWQRPPRRQDPQDDVIRPSLAAPTGDITVVLDTSGSMSPKEHAQAFCEIDAILKKAVPSQAIRVLSVDHEVHTDQRIHHARHITPQGGRGTDMAAGIQTAAETAPAAIIVITDGYTLWPPDPPPGARCVIAALTDNNQLHHVPGWIQAIDISQDLQADPDH